jgi:two-component system sensor histidine kinase UhpB
MAVQSLDELHRLIGDLRPSHLDDLGLGPALRWYGNEIEEHSGLKVSVIAPGGKLEMLPQSITIALFRIAQEAITNIIKHAKAKNAFINISQKNGDITLEIHDDGIGFDTGSITNNKKPKWGLLGMEERAALLGGKFKITSEIGQGTKIIVAIPNRSFENYEVIDD